MAELTFKVEVPEQFKEEFRIALAKALKEFIKRIELLELEHMRKRLESEKEKELTEWSIKLGRKVNKETSKKILSQLPKEKRKELSK